MVAHICNVINPSAQRLKQEDGKFKAKLGYILRLCLKT
jgi:hypothetical protein